MVARQWQESCTTTSTAEFSASLAVQENYTNCSEALTIENRRITGWASKAKKIHENYPKAKRPTQRRKRRLKVERNVRILLIRIWLHSRRNSLAQTLRTRNLWRLLLTLRWTVIKRVRIWQMPMHASSMLSKWQSWLA